jgi:hypothetical protein
VTPTSASAPPLIQFKVVVAGPFAAGKTTFIQHISQTDVVGTEAPTTGAEAEVKETTTVGVEYGTYVISEDDLHIELLLFGVPGQRRFQFMWDIVAEGMDALLVVIDATQTPSWDDAYAAARYLLDQRDCPVAVAINRASAMPGAVELAQSRITIPGATFIECEVIQEQEARNVLVTLLRSVLVDLEQSDQEEEA